MPLELSCEASTTLHIVGIETLNNEDEPFAEGEQCQRIKEILKNIQELCDGQHSCSVPYEKYSKLESQCELVTAMRVKTKCLEERKSFTVQFTFHSDQFEPLPIPGSFKLHGP